MNGSLVSGQVPSHGYRTVYVFFFSFRLLLIVFPVIIHSFLSKGLADGHVLANFKAVFTLKSSATVCSLAMCLDFALFTFPTWERLENR